jgi:hypothetical protein
MFWAGTKISVPRSEKKQKTSSMNSDMTMFYRPKLIPWYQPNCKRSFKIFLEERESLATILDIFVLRQVLEILKVWL